MYLELIFYFPESLYIKSVFKLKFCVYIRRLRDIFSYFQVCLGNFLNILGIDIFLTNINCIGIF